MGAAAARGTHEERVAQAKARNAAEVQRLEAQRAEERRLERERIDAMSEPERVAHIQGIQRQRTQRARLQTLVALSAGMMLSGSRRLQDSDALAAVDSIGGLIGDSQR